MLDIGLVIKRHRLKALMSQTELSVLANVPQTTISCWERGIGSPGFHECVRIAKALGVPVAQMAEEIEGE